MKDIKWSINKKKKNDVLLNVPFILNFHFQVSSGAVDLAKYNLENMLIKCATEIEGDKASEEILLAQKKSLHEVVHELVRQITSPNTIVREQVGQRSRTKKGQV